MTSVAVSKTQSVATKANNNHTAQEDQLEEEQYEQEKSTNVTMHVYLKPAHSSQSLDKNEVLRRIRQRKRANNRFRSTLQELIRLPSQAKPNNPASFPQKSWLDDPFTAL